MNRQLDYGIEEPVYNSNQNLISEKIINAHSGCCMLLIFFFILIVVGGLTAILGSNLTTLIIMIVIDVLSLFSFVYSITGFCIIEINEARVLTLFGNIMAQ